MNDGSLLIGTGVVLLGTSISCFFDIGYEIDFSPLQFLIGLLTGMAAVYIWMA